MSKWNYYFSGILLGAFESGGRTGPTDEQNKELLTFAGLDVKNALSLIPELERAFAGEPEHVTAALGEFSKRGPGLYAQRNTAAPTDLLFSGGRLAAFICPSRESCAVLAREGCEDLTVLAEWKAYGDRPLYPVEFAGTFPVPMRDGVRLATDVYLPAGAAEKLPCVFVRTCYGKSRNAHLLRRYVHRGYALVIQDVRGRDDSEGTFIPMANEIQDGGDALGWIAAQSWSNGKVGSIGGSYLGYTQWAMAASGSPHLAAIVSLVTAGGPFADIPRRGGLLASGTLAWAFMMSEKSVNPALAVRDDWDGLLKIRPIGDIPVKALGRRIPFLDEWLSHPDDGAFWRRSDWFGRISCDENRREVPALILSGWFDDDGMGTAQALELTKNYPKGKRRIILGPWNHNANTRYDIHGVPMGTRALRYDLDLLYLKWFDRHLRGEENGVDGITAEYFTLGQNRWKQAESFPPASNKALELYLGENGALLPEPGAGGADSYAYDPENPATHIVDMSENELSVPEDYTREEKRPDILVYTTPALEKDVVVTGAAVFELYISSDAEDTDFIVRLTWVDRNGRSVKYADGMLSAKYREGFDRPRYLKTGNVYKLTVKTANLSKLFPAGSRLRVTVTSSARNLAFPNSNTKAGYNGENPVVAHNSLHYGGRYPSRVLLPVES